MEGGHWRISRSSASEEAATGLCQQAQGVAGLGLAASGSFRDCLLLGHFA